MGECGVYSDQKTAAVHGRRVDDQESLGVEGRPADEETDNNSNCNKGYR